MARLPGVPGPGRLQFVREIPQLLVDPLQVFMEWRERYGDLIQVPLNTQLTLQLSNPADIRHVLVTNSQNYRKTGAFVVGRKVLGEGLLASGEPLHRHQRQIIQPWLRREKVMLFGDLVVETAEERFATWRSGSVIDLAVEMAHITLNAAAKALFTVNFDGAAESLGRSFSVCVKFMQRPTNFIPEWVPLPLHLKYRAAVRHLDDVVYRLIRERRALATRPDDVLSALLDARDQNDIPLGDRQIRDEVANLLLAGHETTANALAWTAYLLTEHPDVRTRMKHEITETFGEGPVKGDGVRNLTFTEMVFLESMRLYPPVWILGRMSLGEDVLSQDVKIPAGTLIIIIPYVINRSPDYFPKPELFDPERFAPQKSADRLPFVYLPFGAGTRACIGESFARFEGVLLLALIAQRFSLELVPGQRIVPSPLLTLRPRHGIRMRVERAQPNP